MQDKTSTYQHETASVSCRDKMDEDQASAALNERQNLAYNLMDAILERDNLNRAYKQVKANKGAAGVDGMKVGELSAWLKIHKDDLLAALAAGTYQPQPVRAVEIPKPDGSKRLLGIPTVIDRLIQQAILQVLQPLYEPRFFQFKLWLPPTAQCASSGTVRREICQRRTRDCGGY